MKKKVLLFSFFASSLFSMQLNFKPAAHTFSQKKTLLQENFDSTDTTKIRLKGTSVYISRKLGDVGLYHDDNGFSVHTNSQTFSIPSCFVDKELRGISKKNLAQLLVTNAYVSINEIGQNEYSLKLNHRLLGGGAGGAVTGAYIGRFLTYFICHGAIVIASAITGPAAPATFAGLEACFAGHIELASHGVSIAGGIIGGVISGPV